MENIDQNRNYNSDCSGEQPYERFLACGAQSLTNAELIGIILRTGTKGVTAVELGRRVLEIHDPGAALCRLSRDLRWKSSGRFPGSAK